jgi:hypothetical protein
MYSAVNDNDSGYIAVWTSPVGDGVNWTFDGAALQGPVTSGQWNYASFPYVIDPYVFKNSHGFYEMAYTAFSGNYLPHQKMGYAIATTPDGPFYPYAGGPLVDQFSTVYPGDTNIGDGVFIENPNDKTFYPQGTFYLLFNDDNADDDDAGNGTTGLSHGLAATMPDY